MPVIVELVPGSQPVRATGNTIAMPTRADGSTARSPCWRPDTCSEAIVASDTSLIEGSSVLLEGPEYALLDHMPHAQRGDRERVTGRADPWSALRLPSIRLRFAGVPSGVGAIGVVVACREGRRRHDRRIHVLVWPGMNGIS